jgi:N-dimethylarginine dimethylaminohydrolase
MNQNCHTETGKISTLVLKPASAVFLDEEKISNEWETLNFTSRPDRDKALHEYAAFRSIMESHSDIIYELPADSSTTLDSIYCRDASIATNQGLILCRMGKVARESEPDALAKAYERFGIPILGAITSPGTVEGGDVAWLNEHTLAVGLTYRTNEAGIRQLTDLLKPLGVRVIVVPLPHYKGPSDVFHLMSIFSPVEKDLAVVYSPLMPVFFRKLLLEGGYRLIEVPDTEFDTMGSNVLSLAPGSCLMVEGNPQTRIALEEAGIRVLTYQGIEISVKGGGGPTCLTRPISRLR